MKYLIVSMLIISMTSFLFQLLHLFLLSTILTSLNFYLYILNLLDEFNKMTISFTLIITSIFNIPNFGLMFLNNFNNNNKGILLIILIISVYLPLYLGIYISRQIDNNFINEWKESNNINTKSAIYIGIIYGISSFILNPIFWLISLFKKYNLKEKFFSFFIKGKKDRINPIGEAAFINILSGLLLRGIIIKNIAKFSISIIILVSILFSLSWVFILWGKNRPKLVYLLSTLVVFVYFSFGFFLDSFKETFFNNYKQEHFDLTYIIITLSLLASTYYILPDIKQSFLKSNIGWFLVQISVLLVLILISRIFNLIYNLVIESIISIVCAFILFLLVLRKKS
ncbi:MAG: hypothetical protein ACTSU2_11915 [Promethearchaeota archaeon]